jgi:voltage-gated potassium channel
LKQTVFNIIERAPDGYRPAKFFNYFMVVLILLNVTVVILETVRGIHAVFLWEFFIIDLVSVIIFSIEYVLRIWVCTLYEEYSHPITGRLRFMFTPYMIIDGLAILPFYIPFIIPIDLRFLRILRLFRILRILKLGRYSDAVNTFHRILTRKKEQLLLALSLLLIVMVLASALMYDAEHEAQPEVFASIPHAMWWALVTLATVGYGDVYPVTAMGKVLSGVVVIVGIMIFALPTAIFAAGFVEEIELEQEVFCPHCGRKIDKETPQSKGPPKDLDETQK